MKFIHTADWQIGMKAAHVGAVGARIREIRLEAAHKVIETAQARSADFILLAGDTFEDNGVDRVLVQKTADILAKSPVPVYIILGNHDPLIPGSVWDHPAWSEHENLRILKAPEPLEIPGGTLFPCPILEKHSRKDPTAWIEASQSPGPKIGLAHGTVEGMPQVAPDHPIPRDAAQRTGLDYLALGHWHSTATYEDQPGTVHMAYSGTHETTRFGERDSGNVLLVEITEPGTPPTITPLRTGTLTWLTLEEEIAQQADLTRVRSLAEQPENPDNTLIELRLSGLLPGSIGPELARLKELLESRFLYHRLDTDGLRPAPEDETWLEGLPQGVLREAALQLRELAASDQTTDPEASPRVATQALMELYALVQGAEP